MQNEMTIYGLDNDGVAYCEAKGLSTVWAAYAKECAAEYIMQVGFNCNYGNVYIALENGVSIVSSMGGSAFFLRDNPENGEEKEFDNYDDALSFSFDTE